MGDWGGIEPIQTKDQLEYVEESLRSTETYCHSDLCEKPLVKTGVKNLQREK